MKPHKPHRHSAKLHAAKPAQERKSLDREPSVPKSEDNLVPGRKALIELLRVRPAAIRSIYHLDNLHPSPELRQALDDAKRRAIPLIARTKDELAQLAPGTSHQGVLAVVTPQNPISLADLVARSNVRNGLIVALDEIHDPQNLGAILRTADACGADGVIVPERRAVHLTSTVRKISAGAAEFVPLAVVKNLAQALRELKEEQFWILGTALGPDSTSLYEADPGYPLVVVIGSEEDGLRPLTRSLCDYLVRIPMQGAIQSLNASHATAVVLAELGRKRAACPPASSKGISTERN